MDLVLSAPVSANRCLTGAGAARGHNFQFEPALLLTYQARCAESFAAASLGQEIPCDRAHFVLVCGDRRIASCVHCRARVSRGISPAGSSLIADILSASARSANKDLKATALGERVAHAAGS